MNRMIKIIFRDYRLAVLMTFQTAVVRHPFRYFFLSYLVRGVTIGACRHKAGLLPPQLTTNNLLMNLFDHCVACGAGFAYITCVGARFRIGVREDHVRSVAVVACRRGEESFFEKSLSVNTLTVVLYYVLLRDVVVS